MGQVSVIIAALNGAATIARAVRSALAQPEAAEVIVVDDGSTDDTASVAHAAAEGCQRLQVVRLTENRGPSFARNLALDRASGAFVCVLDVDDWMEAGQIGRLLQAAGTGWDFAADDLLLAEQCQAQAPQPMLGVSGPARTISLAEFINANLPRRTAQRQELGYLKPLMCRSFMSYHGLHYDVSLRLGEDYVLYATALALGGTSN
jgi:succinoglycan biosynthesis protein ExoU